MGLLLPCFAGWPSLDLRRDCAGGGGTAVTRMDGTENSKNISTKNGKTGFVVKYRTRGCRGFFTSNIARKNVHHIDTSKPSYIQQQLEKRREQHIVVNINDVCKCSPILDTSNVCRYRDQDIIATATIYTYFEVYLYIKQTRFLFQHKRFQHQQRASHASPCTTAHLVGNHGSVQGLRRQDKVEQSASVPLRNPT